MDNLSFEFFPPRTEAGIQKLLAAAEKLRKTNPLYYSVTFGAGGSTQEATVEAVRLLSQNCNTPIAPHISCIGSTKENIKQLLESYQSLGVNRLVALRGDLPSGMLSPGEFRYANELISFIREVTGNHFHIEVAAYPEFHPQATDAKNDLLNFKRKIECGANSAITQYFYNADAYFHFLDSSRSMQIDIPIIPGIMPITNHQQLARFSDNCGAEIPRWVRKRLASCNEDKDEITKLGIDIVSELCEKLLDGGAPGLHFYSLNHADTCLDILNHLKIC